MFFLLCFLLEKEAKEEERMEQKENQGKDQHFAEAKNVNNE